MQAFAAAMATTPLDLIVEAVASEENARAKAEAALTATTMAWINAQQKPVISLEVPSGLDGDTGAVIDATMAAIAPTWTACFGFPKPGVATPAAAVGTLVLLDIGLPANAMRALGVTYRTPFTDQYMVALKP